LSTQCDLTRSTDTDSAAWRTISRSVCRATGSSRPIDRRRHTAPYRQPFRQRSPSANRHPVTTPNIPSDSVLDRRRAAFPNVRDRSSDERLPVVRERPATAERVIAKPLGWAKTVS